MKGLKHQTELILVRSTPEESERILNREIRDILQSSQQYATENTGLRLLLPDDLVLPIAIDVSRKLLGVQYLSSDGQTIQTFITPFTFSLEGMDLKNTLDIGGYSIRTLMWDAENNVYTVQLDNPTPLVNSTEPLFFMPPTPLHDLLGTEYKTAFIPANPEINRLPGQSDEFVQAYNTAADELFNGIYRANLHDISLIFNRLERQVYFDVILSQTSEAGTTSYFTAEYIFDYTIDDAGMLDLTPVGANETGQLVSFELRVFLDHLENDIFSLHYIAGGFELIGGFYSQDNPGFTLSGYLRNPA
jgi:hypothetical protein